MSRTSKPNSENDDVGWAGSGAGSALTVGGSTGGASASLVTEGGVALVSVPLPPGVPEVGVPLPPDPPDEPGATTGAPALELSDEGVEAGGVAGAVDVCEPPVDDPSASTGRVEGALALAAAVFLTGVAAGFAARSSSSGTIALRTTSRFCGPVFDALDTSVVEEVVPHAVKNPAATINAMHLDVMVPLASHEENRHTPPAQHNRRPPPLTTAPRM
jgi:hypothetical protein